MSVEALIKAKEAILFLCKRCDEQGFYSPPRQQLIADTLEQIDKEVSRLVALKESEDSLYVGVASMFHDTLAANQKPTNLPNAIAAWHKSEAKFNSNYILLYAKTEDLIKHNISHDT